MSIYTTKSGLARPRVPRPARNKHLLPEVSLRSKRILSAAKEENDVATQVVQWKAEYYRRLKNGRMCSCRDESVESQISEDKQTGTSINDFLLKEENVLENSTLCPICFNTGFVGGYDREGVETQVLDATNRFRLNKVNLMKERPYWFRPTDKVGSVTWKVQVPKHFESIANISIRWKEEPKQWSLKVNENDEIEDELENSRGGNADVKLQMKDSTNENAGVFAIFIQFIVSEPYINIDFPNYERSYEGEFNVDEGAQESAKVNISGNVTNISTKDLLIDENGFIWRITRITENNPMDVNISSTLESRLVHKFEKYYMMPSKIISKRYHNNYYTFVL